MIVFDADDAAKNNAGFAEYGKNIALQVAAIPVQYVNKEDVPQAALDEEKEILMAQIANDEKNKNKPAAIIEKMVTAVSANFMKTIALPNSLM